MRAVFLRLGLWVLLLALMLLMLLMPMSRMILGRPRSCTAEHEREQGGERRDAAHE
jgi:hypothetical protein